MGFQRATALWPPEVVLFVPSYPGPLRDGERNLHHVVESGLALFGGGEGMGFNQVGDGADSQRALAGPGSGWSVTSA